ncbi:hypothetical protein IFM89_010048 [Coptis chinensis]|uniref:Protein FAR1-RELATED SEQUENCE n=1 Tax=Coptis chinensis TaxID=261450 RepID=A0A835LPZ1_9MAGN|nr:hypothetical protein IFM89_010048 [Coptis chinensis]
MMQYTLMETWLWRSPSSMTKIRSEETNVYMEEANGEIDKEFAENENAIVDPYVGLEFESEEETYKCYNDYAKIIGFSIRRQHMKHSNPTMM